MASTIYLNVLQNLGNLLTSLEKKIRRSDMMDWNNQLQDFIQEISCDDFYVKDPEISDTNRLK